MMSKEDLEPKLADIMSQIAEVEGIVALDHSGNLISGQTIEEMDVEDIAKKASDLIEAANTMGKTIEKGDTFEITLGIENGYMVAVVGSEFAVLSFVDSDSKAQLALLGRTLKNLL